MKYPLLIKSEVDNTITAMWERVRSVPDEDASKAEQVENAQKIERGLRSQLAMQEKALPALWAACNIINPEHPLTAALSISANAERLKEVIKAYSFPETIGSL